MQEKRGSRRNATALRATECARQTGVTVRALRVYERYGLIAPRRSAQGWRLYGPAELIQLNTIRGLKALGLTLAQIREALQTKPPPLTRILELQLEMWRTRRRSADEVVQMIELALQKLRGRERLSTDELCALLRRGKIRRPAANDSPDGGLTFAEAREARAQSRAMPPQLVAAGAHLYHYARRTVLAEFRALLAQNVPPRSRAAQGLLSQLNALGMQHGFRRQFLLRAQLDPALARKLYVQANRTLEHAGLPAGSEPDKGALFDYIRRAREAARWWRSLTQVHALAQGLKERGADPGSAIAQELARRLTRVCATNALGDAYEYARWEAHFGMRRKGKRWVFYGAAQRAGWIFLAQAARALADERAENPASIHPAREPANVRHYRSPDGSFELDVPADWHESPPVHSNSPLEVIRFAAYEVNAHHLLIIFRGAQQPGQTLAARCHAVRTMLAGRGFENFILAETRLGDRPAVTLDFDRQQAHGLWSCREYFLSDGTHQYTLGFGTTDRGMLELAHRIADSFTILSPADAAAA